MRIFSYQKHGTRQLYACIGPMLPQPPSLS